MIYVAVVCKLWERSRTPEGSWACFIDKQKSEAIKKAIQARVKWERTGNGPYLILVGTLEEEANGPMSYSLQPVNGERERTPECPTNPRRIFGK